MHSDSSSRTDTPKMGHNNPPQSVIIMHKRKKTVKPYFYLVFRKTLYGLELLLTVYKPVRTILDIVTV